MLGCRNKETVKEAFILGLWTGLFPKSSPLKHAIQIGSPVPEILKSADELARHGRASTLPCVP